MFKKITLGGIFILASVLAIAPAMSATTTTTVSAKAHHGGQLTVPRAPVAQGMCGPWGCR
jgi:hypothetical protein